jgi:hypothetical protein
MSDADSFHAGLDEWASRLMRHPGDAEALAGLRALRLVFADWLEERGDAAAGVQRWLARRGKYPEEFDDPTRQFAPTNRGWRWALAGHGLSRRFRVPVHCRIDRRAWEKLTGFRQPFDPVFFKSYASRRAAEEALAAALPPSLGRG